MPGDPQPPLLAVPARTPFAYVVPTRDRAAMLDTMLRRLGGLPRHDAEVVLVDNASATPVSDLLRDGLGGAIGGQLANGLQVHVVRSQTNIGAAARNLGAQASDPVCAWLVMLDDDSWPRDLEFQRALDACPPDVGAIAGEIFLHGPDSLLPRREAGGLPEVFTGCGAIIRRTAMLPREQGGLGGYDPSFGFYAEEYDLSARMMLAGLRVMTDRRARFEHAKTPHGRNMDLILSRLVRNNGWVMQRYAPAGVRRAELRRVVTRYAEIARKEAAETGYREGLGELLRSVRAQARTPLSARQWDRFTGKSACRRWLLGAWAGGVAELGVATGFSSAAIVDEGKNAHVVREVLEEMGVRIVAQEREADVRVIGTLSPGPMWDALGRRIGARESGVLPAWSARVQRVDHARGEGGDRDLSRLKCA